MDGWLVADSIANDVVDGFNPRARLGARYGRMQPELSRLSVWVDRLFYDGPRLSPLNL